jgi:hypothetical protein
MATPGVGWCAWLGVDADGFFDAAGTKARLEAAIDATNEEIDKIREAAEASAAPENAEMEVEGPAETPTSDELGQDGDTDLAERNSQLGETAAERATVEKMAGYVALSDEQPCWRRLVGWIRTRRGRTAM